jgi:hypothetical protein
MAIFSYVKLSFCRAKINPFVLSFQILFHHVTAQSSLIHPVFVELVPALVPSARPFGPAHRLRARARPLRARLRVWRTHLHLGLLCPGHRCPHSGRVGAQPEDCQHRQVSPVQDCQRALGHGLHRRSSLERGCQGQREAEGCAQEFSSKRLEFHSQWLKF